MAYIIKVYEKKNKDIPFDKWLEDQDITVRARIRAKIERIGLGNFGDHRPIDEGIWEIKMDIGPGYRIYYHKIGMIVILILCAGTKRTQSKDIEKAKEYLQDYKMRGVGYGKK